MLISKVLVLDEAAKFADPLKKFCEARSLKCIRPPAGRPADVMAILSSNIDLGGILLSENYGGAGMGLALARHIHNARAELPLFLRRDTVASVAGLSERDAAMFRCAYTMDNLDQLRTSLDASIFSRIYPNELVRGITEISRSSLQHVFRKCEIDVETPYLIKDRFIYGQVFSLISIDSQWCRGYMMLQASEEAMLALIRRSVAGYGEDASFRDLNNVLGEATNLIWGAFKNRYVGEHPKTELLATQVPILINHQRQYISFGSDDPQLCIKYVLSLACDSLVISVPIYQRFVFNMSWSPDAFTDNSLMNALVESGELELF
jgi:Chemotaxis phosphatase CheX